MLLRIPRYFPVMLASFLFLLLLFSSKPAAVSASERDFRVEWLYRDSIAGAHPSAVRWLDSGRFLAVYNGYMNPQVMEVTPAGEITWRFTGLQASSARRLPDGSTLLADSGAPGYPMVPRLIQVDPAGRITWEHRFSSRAQAPTSVDLLANGRFLVTTRDRAFELTREGEKGFLLESLALPAPANPQGAFLYLIAARELPSGNILLVDRGIYGRKNGCVVEVTPDGRVVRRIGPLERPADAVLLENGHLRVLELGSFSVQEYDSAGELVDAISYRQLIAELGVSNQWNGFLLPSGHFLLSISHSWGGATAVLEINDNIPRLFIDETEFLPRGDLLMADGRMLAPARELFEMAGLQLYFHEESGRLQAWRGSTNIFLTLEEPFYELRGQVLPMVAAPRLHEGRTYLPVRLLQEAFGMTLTRGPGEKSRRVNITTE